jgi:hypothetical protein
MSLAGYDVYTCVLANASPQVALTGAAIAAVFNKKNMQMTKTTSTLFNMTSSLGSA